MTIVTQQPEPAPDPLASAYARYEQFESRLSSAMDQLVATNGFAELFTTSASVLMALTRTVNSTLDEAVRATRLAARQDVTSLARQLARTEDKLERLLQAVESISDRMDLLDASVAEQAEQNGAAGGSASSGARGAAKAASSRRSTAKRASGGSS